MKVRPAWPALVLALLAGLCLVAANLAFWAGNVVYDRQEFRQTTRAALDPEPVRREIATKVVGAMLDPQTDLSAPAPELLISALTGILGSKTLNQALDRLLDRAWRIFVERSPEKVTLDATRLRDLALSLLSEGEGALALQIRATPTPFEVELLAADVIPSAAPYRVPLTRWFWGFLLGMLLLGGAALRLAPDRRRTARHLGLIVLVPAVLHVLLILSAPTILLALADRSGDAPLLESAAWVLTARLFWQSSVLVVLGATLYFVARRSAREAPSAGPSELPS